MGETVFWKVYRNETLTTDSPLSFRRLGELSHLLVTEFLVLTKYCRSASGMSRSRPALSPLLSSLRQYLAFQFRL